MFNKHIFDPEILGSKEEEKSLEYEGWAILAHIKAESQSELISKIKYTFNSDSFRFNESNKEYFIEYNACTEPIKVIPQEIKYTSPYNIKTEFYNVIFQSNVFGIKWSEEKKHQELCGKVSSKLRKKRAFWVRESKYFPIPKFLRLIRRKRN